MERRKIGCPQVRKWLSEYLDGAMRAEQVQAVEAHLEGCPQCREELASLSEAVFLLRSLPGAALPRSFTLSSEMVLATPATSRWAWGLAAAMASLALAFFLAGDLAGFLPQGTVALPTPSPAPTEAGLRTLEAAPKVGESLEGTTAAGAVGGWPLTQIELALGSLLLLLLAGMAFSLWRRRLRKPA
ncbi:MAG: zf-HC2 domain-containing protein [Chloroflexi bacterium]|nr:zf-HC2 domain-containing protein [Chloroflexota bacterium]